MANEVKCVYQATPTIPESRVKARTSVPDGVTLCGYHTPTGGWSLSRSRPSESTLEPSGVQRGSASPGVALAMGFARSPSFSRKSQSSAAGLPSKTRPLQALAFQSRNGPSMEVEVTAEPIQPVIQGELAASSSLASVTSVHIDVPKRSRHSAIMSRKQTPARTRVNSLGPNAQMIRLPVCLQTARDTRCPNAQAETPNAHVAKGSRQPNSRAISPFNPPVRENARLLNNIAPSAGTDEALQNRLHLASKRVGDSPRNKDWAPILRNPRPATVTKVPAFGPLSAATARLRSSSTSRPVRTPVRILERTLGRSMSGRNNGLCVEPSYAASTIASKAKQREVVDAKRASQKPPDAPHHASLHMLPNPASTARSSVVETTQRQKPRPPSPFIRHPSPQIQLVSHKFQPQERSFLGGTQAQIAQQRRLSPGQRKQQPTTQQTADRIAPPTRKPSPPPRTLTPGLDTTECPPTEAESLDTQPAERRNPQRSDPDSIHPARRNTLTNIAIRGIRGVTGTQSGPRMALLRRSGSTVTTRKRDHNGNAKATQPDPETESPTVPDEPWDGATQLSDVVSPLDRTLATIKSENPSSSTLVSPATVAASSIEGRLAKTESPCVPATPEVSPISTEPEARITVSPDLKAEAEAPDPGLTIDCQMEGSSFPWDTIASPMRSPSIPLTVPVVSMHTPIISSADRILSPEGGQDKLAQWYASCEDCIPTSPLEEPAFVDIDTMVSESVREKVDSPKSDSGEKCHAEGASEMLGSPVDFSPEDDNASGRDTEEVKEVSEQLAESSSNDLGIDPAVWSFMESHLKRTGLWTQKKSHPCASEAEIKVLADILDREWDAADFDWHENPEELESNVRYALRYGGDQVCLVVSDIFCQGMNKFVTLKREGTSVTIFWPSSLRLQANAQRAF